MLVHMFAKSGSVFAVVAMFLIRMPLIFSPSIAANVAMR